MEGMDGSNMDGSASDSNGASPVLLLASRLAYTRTLIIYNCF